MVDLIVSDVCCVEQSSYQDKKYFVTFLDDETYFAVVYSIQSKSKVTEQFKEYVHAARNRHGKTIKAFRSDNRTEYLTRDLLIFCRQEGIEVHKFRMSEAHDIDVPIEPRFALENAKTKDRNILYRELIGSLLYLSLGTRPDICFGVNYMSTFQSCFEDTHFKHLKRIV